MEQGFDILGAFKNGGKEWFATKKEAETAIALAGGREREGERERCVSDHS